MDKKRKWDSEETDMFQMQNGIWYVRYWSPSRKCYLENSLKTDIKAKAKKAKKLFLESLHEQKGKEARAYKKYKDVCNAFLSDTVWKSEATKKTALNQINNHIIPWFGNYDPDRIDENLWERYASEKRSKDPNCSLFNTRKYIWKIHNWAHRKRIVKDKFVPFDFDEGRKSPGVIVTRLQLNKIQVYLNEDWEDISNLAFEMAFRIGEIKALTWDRVNLSTGEITLEAEHTKTRRARKPVMTGAASEILLRRKLARIESDYVFPSHDKTKPMSKSDDAWQRAKKAAGVKCRFHDLRHTWLTNAFKASNRYAEICEYAGLSLDEALETYVKFNRNDMASIAITMTNISKTQGKTGEDQRDE
jgi:integrase